MRHYKLLECDLPGGETITIPSCDLRVTVTDGEEFTPAPLSTQWVPIEIRDGTVPESAK